MKKVFGRLSLEVKVDGFVVADEFGGAFDLLASEAGIPPVHLVELVVTHGEEMRRLKLEHFGMDMLTDVIAFPTGFDELGPEVPALAGQIFIGADEVLENARREACSFAAEFFFVLAHGLLHLEGWTDGTEAERASMYREQARMLELLREKRFDPDMLVVFKARTGRTEGVSSSASTEDGSS